MKDFRFVHVADLHLGAYRDRAMTALNLKTFVLAIEKILSLKPDFVLFAGDIFNSPFPSLDLVTAVVQELMKLKNANIPLYVIAGSHDYSDMRKSFLHLLESADVFTLVSRTNEFGVPLHLNERTTPVRLAGIDGKKNGLDKSAYEKLSLSGDFGAEIFSIFLFHTTLDDVKPDFLKAISTPLSSAYLPKGYDYYAGGHVHTFLEKNVGKGLLTYPGPLFPNSFSELKREKPSFLLCSVAMPSKQLSYKRMFLETYSTEHIFLEFERLRPLEILEKLELLLAEKDLKDKLVLLELRGIVEGKISDIRIHSILSLCYEKSAYHVLKNTSKLTSSQFVLSQENFSSLSDADSLEEDLLTLALQEERSPEQARELLHKLLKLDLSKHEDEKVVAYSERVHDAIAKILSER
ncbi:DNA repair exonuclease [Candidatus Woesearchaeota archaeon]|nr:DNA repair exonuclease [Nanoarchaeota archaeon]MCB9370689.1 DNA repair exonuclease [Candidatus Woesearchaeota archaeon]USN43773.1 MAG: DNA repair exonuclease [Candidatus Woesearchaeota archaeon]